MPTNNTLKIGHSVPWLYLRVEQAETTKSSEFRFQGRFRVGRENNCEVQVKDPHVSRLHLEFFFEAGQWHLCDLGSANGSYLEGILIQSAVLPQTARIELGAGGPVLLVQQEDSLPTQSEQPSEDNSLTEIVSRYSGKPGDLPAEQQAHHLREAFDQIQKKRAKPYKIMLGAVVLLLISVAGFAAYQQQKITAMSEIAEDIFYATKALEVQVGQIEAIVLSHAEPAQQKAMQAKRTELDAMSKRYNNYVTTLGVYEDLSQEERLIMRVARIFGEYELNIPPDFVSEVQHYIQRWKSTGRLTAALKRAQSSRYADFIRTTFLEQHLPAQFFYLALQESDFKTHTIGPKTRFGFAKGIWQFIPETGMRYGLQTGPLLEEPRYDPKDERFNFEKATQAAAHYLKDIYNGEAQASGLLVLASYNWGHNRVRRLIQGMPENPRERNFWKLLKHYKIPKETYDYVFYIFSAAVIGEDPKLFGFDFDRPLG